MADGARVTQLYVEAGYLYTVQIETSEVSLVRGTTAKFRGNLIHIGEESAIDCYFQYKITGAASWSDTSANKEELTAVGEFSYSITGLTENESYDVRAVAEWTDGTLQNAYGSTETFNAFWVREGSAEDFERGILSDLVTSNDGLSLPLGSLSFDGTNDYVHRSSLLDLQANDWTFEMYVKGGNAKSNPLTTTERTNTSSYVGHVTTWLLVDGTLRLELEYRSSTPWRRNVTSTIKVTDFTKWNYLAISWNATTDEVVFYINDLKEVTTLSHTLNATSGNFSNIFIARHRNYTYSNNYGQIEVAEWRLWDTIRTPAQIEANRRIYSLAGTETNLLAWYKINEGTGTTLADASTTSNDGTVVGATWGLIDSGTRQKPYKISDKPTSEITWTATTPTDTTLAIEAQVQGTTAISGEAVGTGDGVETVFTLDHWPANTPTITVNAVAETGFTLGDDRRTITFDTAPADTHAITASYTAVDDPVALDWEAQTSGNALTVTLVTDDYLWIRQTLETTDPDVTPTLSLMEIELTAISVVTPINLQGTPGKYQIEWTWQEGSLE